MNLNVYSDYVKHGLILPLKAKYTIRDVHALMAGCCGGITLSEKQARFAVKCAAIFHNTNYSDNVVRRVGILGL